ncbi:uncharacterized protein BYT42DRAFT_492529 [Radiomyces spectabilis]|uniref:uncharacterized protein n=1 Tax=Radiomyces spectabilis TaxID=64574 RepID=UPI00221ED877|nr:uncharacterized protein BYT42DRAFT_492529 [Radiomyces spectabilis]KAI8384554.1 hypothetical protein BYT42DRAFT_492529 [Radiomyces spectabilis]
MSPKSTGAPSSSSSSRPSTPASRPHPRKPKFSAFSRSHSPLESSQTNFYDTHRPFHLASTALSAAHAAGMANFTRNFSPAGSGARHNPTGGIFATTTAVQQHIYRLERDLEKLFRNLSVRNRQASFVASTTNLSDTSKNDPSNKSSPSFKRTLFARQSRTDPFRSPMPSSSQMTFAINEDMRSNETHISRIMTSLMDTMQKHKLATWLPLAQDILAILSLPFDQKPLKVDDCKQALDVFDYIREHFKQVDPRLRIISTLKLLLAPCMGNPTLIPSTPYAFHSLVYALVNGLVHRSAQSSPHDRPISQDQHEYEHIRASVLNMFDSLANGDMIPVHGSSNWVHYHQSTEDTIPKLVAKLCVIEALCRMLMVGGGTQINPYVGNADNSWAVTVRQRNRDRIILQELLPRYWIEPGPDTRMGFRLIIFILTEVAAEKFLAATVEDLKYEDSTVSLILQFVQEKLVASKLQVYLTEPRTDVVDKVVTTNVISMLLASLSIASLEIPPKIEPRSPSLSPQLSVTEFPASDTASLWTNNDKTDQASVYSSTNLSDAPGVRQSLNALKQMIEECWQVGYQDFILNGVEAMLEDATSERVVRVFENLSFHIDSTIGEEIVKRTLPTLFRRLTATYPSPISSLCKLLVQLSKRHRPAFYKPVVACVACNDKEKVVSYLTLLSCLRRYMSGVDLWMVDSEMITVLLLSDVGKKKKQPQRQKNQPASPSSGPPGDTQQHHAQVEWGSTSLGQCAIAAEFMWAIKELRAKQHDPSRNMEEDEIAKKFLIDLERRFSVFMAAKEKSILIPITLRVILCNIFLDIRFFCNTTHRPGWLSRAIEWTIQPVVPTVNAFLTSSHHADQGMESGTDSRLSRASSGTLHVWHLEEMATKFETLHEVYKVIVEQLQHESSAYHDYTDQPASAIPKEGYSYSERQKVDDLIDTTMHGDAADRMLTIRNRRQLTIQSIYPISRTTASSLDIQPPSLSVKRGGIHQEGPATVLAKTRVENIKSMNQDAFGSVLSLLVAVFTTLVPQEYSRLARPLWDCFIDNPNTLAAVPAAFLLMQCGEKIPKTVTDITTHDLYCYIPVSSRKRPFRGDSGAFSTPFVPTDLGSDQMTMDEPRWMAKLKNTNNFPIELKRQIQELGWGDDDQGEEHEALKKVLIPLGVLPSLFMTEDEDEIEDGVNEGPRANGDGRPEGKRIDVTKIITRKKRAAAVHSLTIAFVSMVDLLNDNYGGNFNALHELLEYVMRDDAALFLRVFLNDLGKHKPDHHRDILTRVRYLIGMQAKLPPGFTHILFNYLAGMLKWLARENKADGLLLMTLIHPILTELMISTNEISLRDLRKNKIELILVSSGRFWFTQEQQPAAMFPHELTDTRSPFTILDIPWDIFAVSLVRISHLQLLTNFLIRYPREVYAVKKSVQNYEHTPIPGMPAPGASIESDDYYFPNLDLRKRRDSEIIFEDEEASATAYYEEIKPQRRPTQQVEDIRNLAVLRARVWLRFIDILLTGLNKNYNDRAEFENILRSVNSIIIEHANDFGILGQAVLLYTRVVTRFKRLFVSSHGYSAFLPALFKVFCEMDRYPHVRSAITFAWCRFYAVHEEAFVFQMLGVLVPLILKGYSKSVRLGAWMTDNLFALMQAMNNPPPLGSTSDVLGLQLQVELDDLERNIHEQIDIVSNPLAVPLSTSLLKPLKRSMAVPMVAPEINHYKNIPFPLQNFVKLFLTIIAYDPGSLRAEQFVKMFRHMLPRFFKLGGLKDLMTEGIVALIDVFVKFSKSGRPVFGGLGGGGGASSSGQANHAHQGNEANATTSEDRRASTGGTINDSTQHAYGKQWQQNDRLTIKKEFVLLVHEYFKNGGTLSEVNHEKMAMIIRSILREYGALRGHLCSTDWIKIYLVDCLNSMVDMNLRNYTKAFKKLLTQIYTQYRSQWKTVDGADLYEGLAIVLERGQGKAVNMHDIAGLIKDRFVLFGLSLAARQAWANETERQSRFYQALVRVIVAIMENSTQDVLETIEALAPSSFLMGKIVVPIALQFGLQWSSPTVSANQKYRPDPTSHWMRLLGYISRACHQASLLKGKAPGFLLTALTSNMAQSTNPELGETSEIPEDVVKQPPMDIALLLSMSLTALQVVLIRGAASFDKMKGAWMQVAHFLKGTLIFAQSLKSLKPRTSGSGRSSPHLLPSSPGFSPLPWSLGPSSPGPRTSVAGSAVGSTATVYDFATWRLLEFIVSYRSPLILSLRGYIHEKLRDGNSSSYPRSSSVYSTSPRTSGYAQHSPAPTMDSQGRRSRWRSWGGGSSSSPKETVPAVNIIGPSEGETEAKSSVAPASSPTCGLGLHIPSTRSVPPSPSSPSLSVHAASSPGGSDTEAEPGLGGPRSSSSNLSANDAARALLQTSEESAESQKVSPTLHSVYAESITAMTNVQTVMGYRPTLTWAAETSHGRVRPWTYSEAVKKTIAGWQLLLQLCQELEVDDSAVRSQINIE